MWNRSFLLSLCFIFAHAADEGVKFSMRNLCGETIRVYWVGFDNELVPQTQLPAKNSSSVSINSYRTHRFLVWYNRGTEEEVQRDARIYGKMYTVGDTNDIVTVEEGLEFIRHDAPQRSLEASQYAVQSCDPRSGNTMDGKVSVDCVKRSLVEWLTSRRDELDFEWSVYRNLKKGLSYYHCNGNEGQQKQNKIGGDEMIAIDGSQHDTEGINKGECMNMDVVISDGEKELGSARGKGDHATPRKSTELIIDKAIEMCKDISYNAINEMNKAYEVQKALEGLKKTNKFIKKEEEEEQNNHNENKKETEDNESDGNKPSSSLWSKVFGDKNNDNNDDDEYEPHLEGISGVVLGAPAPTPAPALPQLLSHSKEWVKCLTDKGMTRDFSTTSREISRVRNAKGKLAETLRNQTCLDDSHGTVGVPEDEFTFVWTAPVSDFYSGEYDEATGTTTIHDDSFEKDEEQKMKPQDQNDNVEGAASVSSPAYASSFGPPPSAASSQSSKVNLMVTPDHEENSDKMIGSSRGGIGNQMVSSGRQGRTREVTQLLNRNNAGVWLLDDFLSDEECNHLVESARPGLRRATVNEEGNNQAVSQYRNSQAANLMANWRNKSDPIARIQRRIFAFANDVTGYGLTVDGQEPFSVIQYNKNQEYRPHCDGSCDGSPHLHAGRVATMLMYCRVAKSGGGTSFTKAGVHIVPKAGQAAFFAYKGRNDTMDTELTEHSGCPVADGEKWVITQWLRLGVGKKESWTKFDPIGGRL